MTGEAGADLFVFTTPGTVAVPDRNAITDFVGGVDEIAFSAKGIALGLGGAGAAPKPLPGRLFSPRADGTFTNRVQRFAYDGATRTLYYDGDGSGGSDARQIVAILAHHPSAAAVDLFFVS